MTIRLLTDWPYKRASNAGYVTIPAGSIVSVFDAATETGMIAAKVAAASAAAVTWTPPSDAPIYTELLPAEVAATRSLVSGAGIAPASTRKARALFGRAPIAAGVASTTLRTTVQAIRLPYDVYGLRFGLESNMAVATTFSLVKAVILNTQGMTVAQAMDEVANAHNYTPFNVTWGGGNAGATVPARTDADDPDGVTWCDWIYRPILAGQTLLVRSLWPYPGSAWAYPYTPVAITPAEINTYNPAFAVGHWHNTVDNVTTFNSFGGNSTNGSLNLTLPYIEALTNQRVMSVAFVGDSHIAGEIQASSGATPLPPCWAACEAESTASLRFVPVCRGWGGKEATQFYAYALDIIANYKPSILFYQVWSQNDTAQTDNNTELAYAMDVVDRCRAAGIVPVLVTGVPINGGSAGMETARLALNAVIRATGEIVSDRDAAISNGATPVAGYLPEYTYLTNPAHPNAAGYAAYLLADRAALRQAVGRA